ncbi:iron ABC transporter permease [Actinomyces bowdenii]|uniref:FecCD family ABC transporter permease n=1 Tax=Actinomyces bowdenii TaxID=131109 RepID=UPI00214A9EE7|nr:iron ABC transporter permease [Actinomyces bowdenii]MCR2052135.1 iron ABC transporter permease [Actinomyces bowdenii]
MGLSHPPVPARERQGLKDRDAAAAYASYRRRTLIRLGVLLALVGLLLVSFVAALMVGPLGFSPQQVLSSLLYADYDPSVATVVVNLRLPPVLMAVLVGGALALAGVQMQTILDNPLAEPFTLGISAASALGAALAIVTGLVLPLAPGSTLAVAAMTAGLSASLAIAAVSRMPAVTKETTILLGIALVFSCQALLSLVQYRASTESLQQIVFWSMGSLMRATWASVITVSLALALATPVFWINGWRLTAITLGEARAAAMGVNVSRLRSWSLVGVALLASLAVAFVGIIGFVGLVGPHVARGLVGEDQRFLVPASILSGATLLTAAHAVSQIIIPGVAVPVGILTALVGVPVFLGIILGRRRSLARGGS